MSKSNLLSGHRCDPNAPLSARMLILCDELQATATALRYRRRMLIHHLQKERHRRAGRQATQFPLHRVAHADFRVRHKCILHIQRHTRSDAALDFQFARTFHLNCGIKCHFQIILAIAGEHALECLLEQGRIERITHDHVATGGIAALLHLHQTRLVESARVDVQAVAVCSGTQSKRIVMFNALLHEACIILLDVVMRTNRMLELVIDHLAGTLTAWAAEEAHNTCSGVRVSTFEQSNGNRQSRTG